MILPITTLFLIILSHRPIKSLTEYKSRYKALEKSTYRLLYEKQKYCVVQVQIIDQLDRQLCSSCQCDRHVLTLCI